MQHGRQYQIVLDKDIRRYKRELDDYFNYHLNEIRTFCFDCESLAIEDFYDSDVLTNIRFTKPNNESVYYACIFKSEYENAYVFGLASDPVIWTSNKLKTGAKIKPNLVAVLNTKDNASSGLIFAKDCKTRKIDLLMRIDCDSLTDTELAFLESKNNLIITENNEYFIDFGPVCYKKDITLLKNIRNFISNVTFRNTNQPSMKLLTVHVPSYFKPKTNIRRQKLTVYDKVMVKLNRKPDEVSKRKTHRYCMLCGDLIEESYEGSDLKDIVGYNPTKCASCFEKVLISYFRSQMEAPYLSKSHFLSDFPDKKVGRFYLKLLKSQGVIPDGHRFEFIKDTADYSAFYDEIDDVYHFTPMKNDSDVNYSRISRVIFGIDKRTVTGDLEFIEGYRNTLAKYGLTPEEGEAVRCELIEMAKSGKIRHPNEVNQKLKRLLKEKSKRDVKKVKSSSKTEEKGSGFEVGFEEEDFEAMIKQKHSPRPINSIGLYERQSKDIRTGFLENMDSKLFKGKSIRISEV